MTYNHVVSDILRALSKVYLYSEEYESEGNLECPVCGNKGLDSYDICSGCGWELESVSNDEEFSFANSSTLGNYRNTYFILREGLEKLRSKEVEQIYIITALTNFEYDYQPFKEIIDSKCTYGFFEDFESCKQALNENRGDMYAKYYPLATVKIIDLDNENKPRISNVEKWFVWDAEKRGFFETDEEIDYSQGWCKSPSVPLISSAEIYKNEGNDRR